MMHKEHDKLRECWSICVFRLFGARVEKRLDCSEGLIRVQRAIHILLVKKFLDCHNIS